ncbi:MAG: hypothetical protein ABIC82_02350 [bacterium]
MRFSIISGIFLHEFSHYLACKLTFAPVKKFYISRKRGYVLHGKSKIPIVGAFIISFAPLFVGLFGLMVVIYYLNNNSNLIISSIAAVKTDQWVDVFVYFKKWMINLEYGSWKFWLSVFLSLNILAAFTPSKKDYKNILAGIILYIALSYYFTFLAPVNLILVYILGMADIILFAAIFLLIILNLIKKFLAFL